MPRIDEPVESRGHAERLRWNEVLRALREARGVTQEGWAAQIGVGAKTVQRWERGERAPDPGAEAAILAYCRERDLFRVYNRGPLAGFTFSAELLQDLLAEARLGGSRHPATEDRQSAQTAIAQSSTLSPQSSTPSGRSLPAPLTSFIGREQEIEAVRRVLGGARLVTLTGAGGCGKTRLALRIAEELLWAYPHGVWWVELAALAEPALVPGTVATALDVQTTEPQPQLQALKAFLRPRTLLLVLDNCEHLIPACADLVEALLRTCPNLEVLTTSRVSLGIGGETVWQVPPMALPVVAGQPATGNRQSGTVEGTQSSDAVRLFVERARLYRPEFNLTPDNAETVAEVCRRLDGIPLALELAAARVRALSVQQIADRLSDRFRLLTGGSRTALPRHQTLRAALDWSYDLLTVDEQALLRRLAVFAGGFTLEAAEAVGAAMGDGQWATGKRDPTDPIAPAPNVLDLLTSLVDKSLVIAEEQSGIVRYRLLETVRQYAGEKLDEGDEVTATRDRHLDWYLALAQSAAFAYRGPQEPAWMDRLEQEHDNLRAALAWSLTGAPGRSPDPTGLGNRTGSLSTGVPGRSPDRRGLGNRTGSPIQGEIALRLAGSLALFWERRGQLQEGQRWLTQALAAGTEAPAGVRAKALIGAGVLAEITGDSAAARAFHEESLALSQRLGDRSDVASAQEHLGRITFRQGDLPAARVLFEAGLALYQELGDRRGIAEILGRLALIALRQGDIDATQTLSEARLAIFREMGNQDGVADTLEVLATVAGEQGDHERQVALLEESLALYRETGSRGGAALALGSLGMAAWTQADYDRASSLLRESLTLYREVGDSRGIARLLSYQGMIALYQRDYAGAEVLSREALALHQSMGDRWSIGRYLSVLAGAAFGQGQPERAARLYGAASTLRERLGTPLPTLIQVHHDRAVAAARRTLGDDTFAAAWQVGAAMSVDDALDDVQTRTAIERR